MQIIHNNQLLARPIQTATAAATLQQNIIKLKPHQNILPKPAASPQPSPKPSVRLVTFGSMLVVISKTIASSPNSAQ